MTDHTPTLLWLRRDLRVQDHAALTAAIARGGAVIPVFILDDQTEGLGAAAKFRIGLGLDAFAKTLAQLGSRLILRRGAAQDVLRDLCAETGARAVYWSRAYDPQSQARDSAVKTVLSDRGIEAKSFTGHVLFEPWSTQTKQGGYYKVYTPFWRAVQGRDPGICLPSPSHIPAPEHWPVSDVLSEWRMGRAMRRGGAVVGPRCIVGSDSARERLEVFLARAINTYATDRDFPARSATSGLSENLAYGEISPREIWWAGQRAAQLGAKGAEHFLKELVWREFAYHLLHFNPQLDQTCFRSEWNDFSWNNNAQSDAFNAWCYGVTGIDLVDAGMRELWVTGRMHNRVRMIVASYLTKHLMVDWRLGMAWFAEQLIDWDPASNPMGWQWVAGCGPDAAPYFRIFNPDGQADKFDPQKAYRRMYLREDSAFFDAIPKNMPRPNRPLLPIVSLSEGRARALAAYDAHRAAQ